MRQRVLAALQGLVVTPRRGDIKKLAGAEADYRLRVGHWRVFFTVGKDDRTVSITGVRHRSSAYDR